MNTQRTTQEWQALDAAHHIHPFSDMGALNRAGSRVIVRGEGVYLWDSEGHKILDGMAGLWCVNVGYGRKELADAAARQMQELAYYNTFFKTTHPAVIELSRLLAEVTPPGFEHFFFTNSGSEGNDTIIRMVRRYWDILGQPERKVIISRHNAYHGSTVGAASLGGMDYMHSQGGLPIPDIEHIDQPYWYAEGGDLSPEAFGLKVARQLEEKILAVGPERVAAFIGEPFQGAGGVIFPPDSYWPEIQRICRQYGILLVADEVIGGFGRTGHWFASQHFGIEPDLMTIAKGMTSGYIPMGGVAISRRVADPLINEGGDFNHGLTYSGHPVAAAVAIRNIGILREEGIVERVMNDTGPYFQRCLKEALADNPLIGEVAGTGLVAGMQLTRNKATRELFPNRGEVGLLCRDFCFANNLIMRATGERMLLSPPLVISRSEIDELVSRAQHCITLTARKLGMV